MDLNYVLIWMLGAFWVSEGVIYLRHRRWPGAEVWKAYGPALVAFVAALVAAPALAGYAGAVPLVVMVVVPAVLTRWQGKLVAERRFDRARRVGRLALWLQPLRTGRERQRLFEAAILEREGRRADALDGMRRTAQSDSQVGWAAKVQLLRMEQRWEELRRYVDGHPRRALVLDDEQALVLYLRSLGESGDVEAMLHGFAGAASRIYRMDPLLRRHTWLFVGALAGRADIVEILLWGVLSDLDHPFQAFWRATALQASGRPDLAGLQLAGLGDDPRAAAALQRRREHPLASVGALSPPAQEVLGQVARHAAVDRRVPQPVEVATNAPATRAIMALLVAAFMFEVPSGATDLDNLLRLGALVLPIAGPIPWWRFFSACLLHFGLLHLAMNLIGVHIIARQLEQLAGGLRTALCFAVSGPGSLLLTALLAYLVPARPTILVGASGGVMGCVGGLAAVFLARYLRAREHLARQALSRVAMIVGLQVMFDLSTPEVSFSAHASGLAIGFLLLGGVELVRGPWRPRVRAAPAPRAPEPERVVES